MAQVRGDEENLAVQCSDCGARTGAPCVYLWPLERDGRPVDKDFVHYRSSRVQDLCGRAGTPMKRCHKARYNAAGRRLERLQQRVLDQAIWRPSSETLAAARAMREWDLREHLRLRAWLKINAGLLTQLA